MTEPKVVKIRKKRQEPTKPKIHISCQLDDIGQEILEVGVKDRRALNKLLFKDTMGRTRLGMEDEPLLSNYDSPAIAYQDGEEEFWINGIQAEYLDLPHIDMGPMEVSWPHNPTGGPRWKNLLDSGKDFQIRSCRVELKCEDDWHGWEVHLETVCGKNAGFLLALDGVDWEDPVFMNDFDLDPILYFHSPAFGQRLGHILSGHTPDNYHFVEEDNLVGIIEAIEEGFGFQSGTEEAQVDDDKVDVELAELAKEDSGPGFGTMVAAGLATVAVGALGAAAFKSKVAAQTKVEVRA